MGESRKGRDSSVKELEGEVMRRGRREGVEKKEGHGRKEPRFT